jgi:hypothetical protein
LKRELIRGMEQIPFRIINFLLFSHLFISRVLNYISNDNLSIFIVKGMTIAKYNALKKDLV